MNPANLGVMIPIIAIGGGLLVAIFNRKYENEERMAMIAKGLDPGTPRTKHERRMDHPHSPFRTLKLALGAIGVGIGIITATIVAVKTPQIDGDFLRVAMGLVGGGAGLLIAYLMNAKNDEGKGKE
jgi:hypothetical protein